jgi:uncharacterized protein YycO
MDRDPYDTRPEPKVRNNMVRYYTYRDKMQTGDLIQWSGCGIISGLIKLISWSKFNHSSIVIRPSELGVFKDRRFILEALESGIVVRLLSERIRTYGGHAWWYPLKDDFMDIREDLGKWALDKEGTPYDFGSLFKNIFGHVSADAREFFCSEFVAMNYKEHGMIDFKKAPRPVDMPNFNIFKPAEKIV